MTDKLTTRMHALGDNVTLTPLPPAQVRANAERRRRTRRLTGAVSVGVIAMLVGTGVLVGELRSAQTAPPINSPGPPSTTQTVPPVLPERTPPIQPSSYYELMFARDENVVLVLESTVVSDRPHVRIENAVETAIPSQRGRCPGSTGSCRPTTTSAPELYDLAPDPTLTGTDLKYFASLSSYHPEWTTLSGDTAVPTLTTCFADPAGLGATQAHVAAFVTVSGSTKGPDSEMEPRAPTDPGYLIETILRFDDQQSAASAYRSIRDQAGSCDYAMSPPMLDGANPVPNWPVDEVFIAVFEPPA